MQAEAKRDVLFAIVACIGFVNALAGWALLLLVLHGAIWTRMIGPAIVFVGSALLMVLTCAAADFVGRHTAQRRIPNAPPAHPTRRRIH